MNRLRPSGKLPAFLPLILLAAMLILPALAQEP